MRPRVFPAEDLPAAVEWCKVQETSMRPRVFPAEDVPDPVRGEDVPLYFNEAAGIPRGRPARRPARARELPELQ